MIECRTTRGSLPRILATTAFALLSGVRPVAAQEPPDSVLPPPDTLVADTVEVVPDSVLADSVQVVDSIGPVYQLPVLPADVPPSERIGIDVWRWDREALLARPNFTILELLATLPGTIPLRAGDYGSPEGIAWDGIAGGRLRVFFDGVEEIGLVGNGPDLSRVSLAGLEEVVVRRLGGEIRIELHSLDAASGGRALTLIEAGTGDLDTNIFRGTFVSPNALGGGVAVGVERLDTQGPRGNEPGTRQGVWLRYLRPLLTDDLTLAAELRRRSSGHGLDPEFGPSDLARTTLTLRGRYQISPTLGTELFWARTSLSESEDSISPLEVDVTQIGARLGWADGPGWGRAEVRRFDGDLPSLRIDLDGGVELPGVAGVAGHYGVDRFDGSTRAVWGVSGRTAELFGFSAFGTLEGGERGWRSGLDSARIVFDTTLVGDSVTAVDTVTVSPVIETGGTSRDHLRAGIRWRGWGTDLSAAFLRVKTDSIRPLATWVDRGGTAFPGDEVDGWEARLRHDLTLPRTRGLYLDASYTRWDRAGIYRPEEIYRGGIGFRRTYFDSGELYEAANLEFDAGIMVEGRSGMQLPIVDPDGEPGDEEAAVPLTVPFYQSWNAWLQIRVLTVRIFLRFENLTLRQNNQDYPGRLLPATRALYGVRWTLFN